MREKDIKKIKKLILPAIALGIVVITIVVVLASSMQSFIDSSVYAERKELLGRLTESSADIIDQNVIYGQTLAGMFADDVYHDLKNHHNFADMGEYIETLSARPSFKEMIFFFVDSNGKYYSSDGVHGKMVDTTYYTNSSEDSLSYISSLPHMSAEKAYLIFRNRLSESVEVETENGVSTIIYSGMLYDIDSLNETVSSEFAGANNTFIFSTDNGVMLYKSFGIKQLIDGFNVYAKFDHCTMDFGEKPEEIINACQREETIVVSFSVEDQEYYFCSAPMVPKDWSVAFIVQSSYLDEMSNSSFRKVVLYIALIAMILGLSIIVLVAAIYRSSITEKSLVKIKELNEELVKATNAKSDFLSNMSHDIRTPINGIMGMTTIAKGVEGNPERTLECLNKIESASRHLLSLINDVLDISRIERGKTEIASRPIDVRMIVDNCSSIIRGQMTGRQLNLVTEIDCDHVNLLGDDLHLRQIIINILGNAVKFTRDGGTIWFRCREQSFQGDKATIVFEIEDTGIGMKPEFLDKIFDVFTQDEGGARSKYKGTGLGMAISKQLTELMGGTIAVESELDKGSKFTVTVPFTVNTEVPQVAEEVEADASLNGVRILMAEDNELNMEIAVELLTDAGAVVTAVEDGSKALETFSSNPPGTFDVILMDVMMPVMNGLEAARAIRSHERADGKTIPILAMTANAFESDIQATAEAGMNAHLIKPINVEEVIKTVAHYANKQ